MKHISESIGVDEFKHYIIKDSWISDQDNVIPVMDDGDDEMPNDVTDILLVNPITGDHIVLEPIIKHCGDRHIVEAAISIRRVYNE